MYRSIDDTGIYFIEKCVNGKLPQIPLFDFWYQIIQIIDR